jgi:hypothetical protein
MGAALKLGARPNAHGDWAKMAFQRSADHIEWLDSLSP